MGQVRARISRFCGSERIAPEAVIESSVPSHRSQTATMIRADDIRHACGGCCLGASCLAVACDWQVYSGSQSRWRRATPAV
jgi:hypothetical protein